LFWFNSGGTAMTRGVTQDLIDPSCEIIASKFKYFNLGRKPHRLKRAARKNVAAIAIAATHVCTLTFHGIP